MAEFDPARLRAVILDVDGTLYRQAALRKGMLVRLARGHALRPWRGLRTLRILRSYRHGQEHLRAQPASRAPCADLAAEQIRFASERTGMDPRLVAECVNRWMEQEPLDLVARHARPGLQDFLETCHARGVRVGVLSDYPAEAKLRALGIDHLVDVVITAQLPEVGVFKPHPRGLQLAMERLGVSPSDCVYIGDRPDVDAVAAAAVGMPCAIVVDKPSPTAGSWLVTEGFAALRQALFGAPVAQRILDRR